MSSPEQVQLLVMLIQLMSAKRILEIGTFTGYTALRIGMALPADGRLYCCDTSEQWTAIARDYWREAGIEDKVELRLAPALQTLDSFLECGERESFDFAYIDADKENYMHYYERSLALIRPGGMIAIDNTLWSGKVVDPKDQSDATRHIRALNQHIYEDERIEISLLPIGDGLTLARKNAPLG